MCPEVEMFFVCSLTTWRSEVRVIYTAAFLELVEVKHYKATM